MSEVRVVFTMTSRNSKTGPMPVTTTTSNTCAINCVLLEKGCYARSGPLRLLWDRLDHGLIGMDWETFCARVAALPRFLLWRHNQAGDLPGDGHLIDAEMMWKLLKANMGKRGFTYTHYPMVEHNRTIVEACNKNKFVINLSANNLEHADVLADLECGPVVSVVPMDYEGGKTPGGRKVVVCPAQMRDGVTCMNCALCASARRKTIIGFRAHGTWARQVEEIGRAF